MKLPCPIRPLPRKTCRLVLGVVVVVVNDRHHVGPETSRWEGSIGLLVCWVVGLFQLGRKIDDCMGCCMLHYAFLSVCMAFSFSFLCRLNARGMSMLVCVDSAPLGWSCCRRHNISQTCRSIMVFAGGSGISVGVSLRNEGLWDDVLRMRRLWVSLLSALRD